MEYIKTFESFGLHSISKSITYDIKTKIHNWNKLMRHIMLKGLGGVKKSIDDVDLEHTDKNGNTALLLASSVGSIRMVKLLIDKGANIYHRNQEGSSFYDVAKNKYKFINGLQEWIEKEYDWLIKAKNYNI